MTRHSVVAPAPFPPDTTSVSPVPGVSEASQAAAGGAPAALAPAMYLEITTRSTVAAKSSARRRVWVEPCNRACNRPAPQQQHKALGGVAASHNFDNPVPQCRQRHLLLPLASAPPTKTWRSQGKPRRISDASCGARSRACTSAAWTTGPTSRPSVSRRMLRSRPHHLLGSTAARPTAFGGLHRLAVDDTGGWARPSRIALARFRQKGKAGGLPGSRGAPGVEIAWRGGERRQITRQNMPLAARLGGVDHGIHYGGGTVLALPSSACRRRQVWRDDHSFDVGAVACVAQAFTPILSTRDLGPGRGIAPTVFANAGEPRAAGSRNLASGHLNRLGKTLPDRSRSASDDLEVGNGC